MLFAIGCGFLGGLISDIRFGNRTWHLMWRWYAQQTVARSRFSVSWPLGFALG